jgi:tetratricopeptide (TPR) repeat protein
MTTTAVEDARRALQLASEAWATRDVPAIVAHLSAAVRGFTEAGEARAAAMTCVRLGDVYSNMMGNVTAGRAWFARARRLVGDEPPCIEQGWVAVAEMGCEVPDPQMLLAGSELALERARQFGDVNLETKALADGGLALVQAGRIDEGMAMLDEAMALACGPADDTGTAAKSVCSFFTACYVSGDFERAGAWTDLIANRGLTKGDTPDGAFLSGHCDTVRAALLVETGRWGEAEATLLAAKRAFEEAMQSPTSWHPDIALADLRTRQGRYTDAEQLLVGKDQLPDALLPQARLHLARGDHDLARATARRGLRAMGDDRLRAIELLVVVIDAELAAGDVAAATTACDELVARCGSLDVPALRARAAGARARAVSANGDVAGAIAILQAAVDDIDPVRLAWIHADLLIELARLRELDGDRACARLDADAAIAALRRLDVVVPDGATELLTRLASRSPGSSADVATLKREGKWWDAAHRGARVRLHDSKGLAYVADLIANPGAERHALDLVDRVEGVDPGGLDRRALGDAGELLDTQARTAYRHRIEALRLEADEAIEAGMLERAEAIQDELDQLVAQLAAAFGLGGRDRRASSAAERARLNVTRAVRAAIAKVTEALPAAGAALDRHVRTGLYCSYVPVDGELRWIVQSRVNEGGVN